MKLRSALAESIKRRLVLAELESLLEMIEEAQALEPSLRDEVVKLLLERMKKLQ